MWLRYTWPTCEHGTNKMPPPHCQILSIKSGRHIKIMSYLERQFILLAAPNLESGIVVADLFEPLLVDSKQTASMCWRSERDEQRTLLSVYEAIYRKGSLCFFRRFFSSTGISVSL